MAGDGAQLRGARRQAERRRAGAVNLGIAVDVERKDGSREPDGPLHPGRRRSDFKAFHAKYEELVRKTRENALTADDFIGTNITLTNPGGLGTVASVPRLMTGQGTIIATGSIAYPPEWSHSPPERMKTLGVSKVMTMTSTYDHRIIQGAESGSFLRRIDELLQGEDEFYEGVAADFGIEAAIVTKAHPASASAPPLGAGSTTTTPPSAVQAAPGEELLQAVQAATSLLKAYRTHGHLSATLNPLGGDGKGDPALEPENLNLTPELMGQIPASILRIGVPGETLLDALPRMRDAYCGTIAYQIEHLSSHQQRVWLREMIETGAHREPLDEEEKRGLLRAADRGVPVRALPPEGIPRPEDVLDRGSRLDRADDRRAGDDRPPGRRRGGRDRDGPPRPPLASSRTTSAARSSRSWPSSRAPRRSMPSSAPTPSATVAPATSSTTTAPRGCSRRARVTSGCGCTRTPPTSSSSTRSSPAAPAPLRPSTPARGCTTTLRSPCRCCCTATPHSRARESSPRRSTSSRSTATRPAARSTSSPDNQVGFTTDPQRRPLDPVCRRHGEGLQRPDHPRQRRRRRGLRRGGPPGDGLPQRVRPRRRHRPDRLSPLRPQRDRRARIHPARAGGADQEAPAGQRDLREASCIEEGVVTRR